MAYYIGSTNVVSALALQSVSVYYYGDGSQTLANGQRVQTVYQSGSAVVVGINNDCNCRCNC